MAKNQEVEDILFGGGLTPDAKLPEEKGISQKDFDMFGEIEQATEEEDEGSLQNEEGEEENEEDIPQIKPKKTPSTVDLLMQQNQLLQQQLVAMNGKPQISVEDQRALETGNAILNLQKQNLPLYNKLNSFLASELNGESTKVQNNKLTELKQMLKGEKFKTIDTSPFEAMIDAVELTENSTKKETQQLIQIINNLQRDINGLKQDKEDSYKQTVSQKEQQALLELKKAELDFGKKLEKGTEEAEDFVLLVRAGRNPRTAYLKVMGLRESDKLKKGAPREVNLNPKGGSPNNGGGGISNASKQLGDKLFARTKTSKDIFKAR